MKVNWICLNGFASTLPSSSEAFVIRLHSNCHVVFHSVNKLIANKKKFLDSMEYISPSSRAQRKNESLGSYTWSLFLFRTYRHMLEQTLANHTRKIIAIITSAVDQLGSSRDVKRCYIDQMFPQMKSSNTKKFPSQEKGLNALLNSAHKHKNWRWFLCACSSCDFEKVMILCDVCCLSERCRFEYVLVSLTIQTNCFVYKHFWCAGWQAKFILLKIKETTICCGNN